jgi:hypothetical protein
MKTSSLLMCAFAAAAEASNVLREVMSVNT